MGSAWGTEVEELQYRWRTRTKGASDLAAETRGLDILAISMAGLCRNGGASNDGRVVDNALLPDKNRLSALEEMASTSR